MALEERFTTAKELLERPEIEYLGTVMQSYREREEVVRNYMGQDEFSTER